MKFVSNWLFTPKLFKDLDNAVSFNDDIGLDNVDTDNVTFFNNSPNNITYSNDVVGLININLNKVNLDAITLVNLIAWCNRYKQHKAFKNRIDIELMPIVW